MACAFAEALSAQRLYKVYALRGYQVKLHGPLEALHARPISSLMEHQPRTHGDIGSEPLT
jgi:hypothetical protein